MDGLNPCAVERDKVTKPDTFMEIIGELGAFVKCIHFAYMKFYLVYRSEFLTAFFIIISNMKYRQHPPPFLG